MYRYLVCLIMLVLIASVTAYADDSLNVDRIGLVADYWGTVSGIDVEGNLAVIASGWTGLRMVWIEDPNQPVEIGKIELPGQAIEVVVQGDYAYVATVQGDGFTIINIANPEQPFVVGTLPVSSRNVTVSGNYAYLIVSGVLRVIDISNPSQPVQVGTLVAGSLYNLAVNGDYVYAVDGSLYVIDVSEPDSPFVVNSYFDYWFLYIGGIAVTDGYLYVTSADNALRVFDISDPENLVIVNEHIPTLDGTEDICISNGNLYLADPYFGLEIYDLSNPVAPALLGWAEIPAGGWAVDVNACCACLIDPDHGLHVLDITYPAVPSEIGSHDPGTAWSLTVSENLMYVGNGDYGLRIMDVSDPANPTDVGRFDTPTIAGNVVLSGDLAYVCDGWGGLRILNIANPAAPFEVGFWDPTRPVSDILIAGNIAYVANELTGLVVLDVTNPAMPSVVGSCLPCIHQGFIRDIALLGENYAAVAAEVYGVCIADVSNPAAPIGLWQYDPLGYIYSVAVTGNYVYAAAQGSGLLILDATDPTTPTLVNTYPLYANDVQIHGNYAFVAVQAGPLSGVHVLDISNPVQPVSVGYYHKMGPIQVRLADNNLLYAAEGTWIGIYNVEAALTGSGVPEAPDSLIVSYQPADETIQLHWTPSVRDTTGDSVDVDYYIVYRGTEPDASLDSIGIPTPPNATFFVDSSITEPYIKYFYTVKAVNN